jgi:hypothetical protein
LICNQQVIGSSPIAGSMVNRGSAASNSKSAWTLLSFQSLKVTGRDVHWIDAKTGPEIVQHHVLTAFQIAAMNKISRSNLSPSGVNRTLEFLGGKPLPIPLHA